MRFLHAKAAAAIILAIAMLSVYPFVHPSHGWISQKRCNLGSPNLYPRLPGSLLVSGSVKIFHKFEMGHPEQGH